MPDDIDDSDEDLGKAIAALLASSQGIPRMIEAMRALSGQFSRKGGSGPDGNSPPKEPLGLLVEAHASLFARSVEYWKEWQDIVSEHVPLITDKIEAYSEARRGGNDRGNRARNGLIDAFRRYAQDLSKLPTQHGKLVTEDLDRLAREYLSNPEVATPAAASVKPKRRTKAKSN